jgi:hypothetical protein
MKMLLTAVLALTLSAVAAASVPRAPQALLEALWATCYADKWVVFGDYALTCVVERIRNT